MCENDDRPCTRVLKDESAGVRGGGDTQAGIRCPIASNLVAPRDHTGSRRTMGCESATASSSSDLSLTAPATPVVAF